MLKISSVFKVGLFGALVMGASSTAAAQELALEAAQAEEDIPEAEAPPLPEVAAGEAPEGSVSGMGDINLYPRRVILDPRRRVASIGLYNKTTFEGEYEISATNMLMTSSGQIIPFNNLPEGADTSGVKTASEMLRWSPRRVLLLGSEAQTVRIMARPPADLPDGEYRAHFSVVSVPTDVDEGFSIDDAVNDGAEGSNNVGVTIRPRFGISIPVIVRIGDTTLDVGLKDIGFVQGEAGPLLRMTITRSGTRSSYGDIEVRVPGESTPLLVARGIGVYPEIDHRTVIFALNPEFDLTKLRSGMTLTATYTDDDVNPGNTLARQDFVIP